MIDKFTQNSLNVVDLSAGSELQSLSILAFSDCRTQNIRDFIKWLSRRPNSPDLIMYAGDDCQRFRPGLYTNYFERIAKHSRYGLVAVIGNDDTPDTRDLIEGKKVYEIYRTAVRIGPFVIVGLDGAPTSRERPGIGFTLHSEGDIASYLNRVIAFPERILLVSHSPPYGVLDKAVRFSPDRIPRSIGSTALREILTRDNSPQIVVCGHVHSQGGLSKVVDQTRVINVASHDGASDPLRLVEFVWDIGIPPSSSEMVINVHLLYPLSKIESVHGIGSVYANRLRGAGIRTIRSLAKRKPEEISRVIGWKNPQSGLPLVLRAMARIEGNPIIYKPFEGPKFPRLFFDIETDPYGGHKYVWLIGCFDEETGEMCQFFSPTKAMEGEILQDFTKFCQARDGHTLVAYSGSNFDRNSLIKRMTTHKMRAPATLQNAIDLFSAIRRSVALPTASYGLKDAASSLGYNFRHPQLDGWAVAYAYELASRSGEEIPVEFLEYNEDDVLSLVHLTHKLETISTRSIG